MCDSDCKTSFQKFRDPRWQCQVEFGEPYWLKCGAIMGTLFSGKHTFFKIAMLAIRTKCYFFIVMFIAVEGHVVFEEQLDFLH